MSILVAKLKQLEALEAEISQKRLLAARAAHEETSSDVLGPDAFAKRVASLKSFSMQMTQIDQHISILSKRLQEECPCDLECIHLNTKSQEILATAFPLFLKSVASCAENVNAIEALAKGSHLPELAALDKVVDRIAALNGIVSIE